MSVRVFLYDDPADVPRFLPFSDSRPIGELRYGAWLIRERVAQAFGAVAGHVAAPHLAAFTEPGAPPVVTPAAEGLRLFFRSSFVPDRVQESLTRGSGPVRFVDATGATIGCALGSGAPWPGADGIAEGWPSVPLPGRRLVGAWLIVGDLAPVLRGDLAAEVRARDTTRIPAGCTVIGDATQLIVDDRKSVV